MLGSTAFVQYTALGNVMGYVPITRTYARTA